MIYGNIINHSSYGGLPTSGGIPQTIGYRLKAEAVGAGRRLRNHVSLADLAPAGAIQVRPFDGDRPRDLGADWSVKYTQHTTPGKVIRLPNSVIPSVKIIGLDKRSEGGGAYIGLVDLGSYGAVVIDVREDVVLWVLQNGSVKKGVMKPPKGFVFGQVASQTRLVAVGSPLHGALARLKSPKTAKKIPASKLEVGRAYGIGGGYHVFLGMVRATYDVYGDRHVYGDLRDIERKTKKLQAWSQVSRVSHFRLPHRSSVISLAKGENQPGWFAEAYRTVAGKHVELYGNRTIREALRPVVDVGDFSYGGKIKLLTPESKWSTERIQFQRSWGSSSNILDEPSQDGPHRPRMFDYQGGKLVHVEWL